MTVRCARTQFRLRPSATRRDALGADAYVDCVRYTVLNPVVAGLGAQPEDWGGLLFWPGGERRGVFERFHRRDYERC